ncbi:hypothetical protein EMPS_04463 [Entomortierella parvispora]|uniref:EamA domain-containing protein n=1 Tax=Entomortierella parvispora TaxID=205924 RepID=A0A9P3H8P3_9FUNG|nr:hypothetical protein EMPS_04463 [Entomortierella parvispora]
MTNHQETSPLLHHGTSATAGVPYNTTPVASSAQPAAAVALTADQRHQETKGLIYMTLSAFFFSFMSLLVSLTAKSLPSFEIVFFRGVIQTVLGVVACRYLNISPFGQKGVRFLLFCRGFAGSCGLGFFFYALSVLPLADATVIFFLGPVFTAILARIVLKEPFTPLDALASSISMVGVVLVAKPSVLFPPSPISSPPSGGIEGGEGSLMMALLQRQEEDHRRLFGALSALCGAMCSAVAYVLVRKIGKQGAHSMQHVTYFGVVSCFVSAAGLYVMQGGYVAPEGNLMWTGVLTLGVSAFVGQILLNSGLQLAPIGPGTLMRQNDIVFAFIFQITVQHEQPDLFSFLGASLVMICTGGMALNKWRLEKKRVQLELQQANSE